MSVLSLMVGFCGCYQVTSNITAYLESSEELLQDLKRFLSLLPSRISF
jgi:hypothetical protein